MAVACLCLEYDRRGPSRAGMSIDIMSDETDLTRKVWRFFIITRPSHVELRLVEYAEHVRKSRRHKWRCAAVWPFARVHFENRQDAKPAECPGWPPPEVCEKARSAVLHGLTLVVEGDAVPLSGLVARG